MQDFFCFCHPGGDRNAGRTISILVDAAGWKLCRPAAFRSPYKSKKMKKFTLQILLFFVAFLSAVKAEAKVWRVNNNGYSADFANLGVANADNRVVNGDTLHLEGSSTAYPSVSITKRLVILGPGYFLVENPGNSVNSFSAAIEYISFNAGSSGAQLQGVHVFSQFGIGINTSNILIKRCRVDNDISLTYNISDVRILQNYFTGLSNSVLVASQFGFPTDVVFNNNIVRKQLQLPAGYTFLECNNNVFDLPTIANASSLTLSAGTFKNNIVLNSSAIININSGSAVNVSHNVVAVASPQFSGNNNLVSNRADLFVTPGTSTDGNYQLRSGSPASANGSDGTDRGAFGGISPAVRYTLSGLPPIPVIYELVSESVAGPSGLTITIKARTVK
jgi:hypothetical protein